MSVAKKLSKKPIDEKLLKKLIPLNALSADRLRELAEKADIEQASASRVLFKAGDATTKTYYLLSGEVEVQLPSGQKIGVKADTPAALHPLAEARPRQATVVIKTSSTLLRIDTNLLDILLPDGRARGYEVNEIHTEDENDWMTRFLQSLSVMNIPIKNIENLIASMEEQRVQAGQAVIRQSEADPQHYFVVKQGRCVVTKQVASGKTPIRVAELNEGVGFGEEALLTRQPRNATVTMLTDGSIMRLNKPDFTRLIAEPAVQVVAYAQARDMVEAGAIWIDARGENEHRQDGIIGSTNIPLAALRLRARELNSYGQYIVYCDSGNRANAAAFLLRQSGLAAFALSNGLNDVPAAARHGHNGPKSNEPAEIAAVVSLAPARNASADSPKPAQSPSAATLKPASPSAVTATENVRSNAQTATDSPETTRVLAQTKSALAQAQAELESLRVKLNAVQAKEQELTQRLARKQSGIATELEGIAQEQAQLKHRLTQAETARSQLVAQTEALRAELNEARTKAGDEARRANEALQRATTEVARYRDEATAQKARINEYALNLTSAEAAYESVQQELDGLRRTQERTTREQQTDYTKLKTEIAAKAADLETMRQQLEREVDQKRAAQEALLTAQREAARLKAEADAARKRAEELARRANDSESQQSALMQEVLRKVEAAELMRLEAEEQAQKLREAADLSRKRAEDEARRAAEVEAARLRALEESERRARMTDEIRRKADEEIARLKTEADAARTQAEDARKKSVAAEAARRQIEEEIKRQPRAAAPAAKAKADAAPENELENIEQELARLQEKLESKKRAAVTRQQERTAATPEVTIANSGEPELLQNVYDIHQKTQKLPAFKQNTDVGKVRKSGWISDSILWETTIGLRDDNEAEKELGNTPPAEVRGAEPPAPDKARIEPSMRALSSGELRMQEAKRSVFTTREAATSSTQRRMDTPQRGGNKAAIFAALAAAALAVGITYVAMDDSGAVKEKVSRAVEKTATRIMAPATEPDTTAPAAPSIELSAPQAKSGANKAGDSPAARNGAIPRKDASLAEPAPKAKRDLPKPAPKTTAESAPTPTAAAKRTETPPAPKQLAPEAPSQTATMAERHTAPITESTTNDDADESGAESAAPAGAPLFTDKAQVN